MRVSRAAEVTALQRPGRLASVALLFSASFLLSRLLGVVRTVAIASVFGSSRTAEAYFAAFRIPDTMFVLVSGGALASAFIPVFAGMLEDHREVQAWRVASTVFNTVCIALAALALFAFIFAPLFMNPLVGGFTPGERGLSIGLTRIMLLQPIFLGAAALVTAVLQSYNRFLLTAVAPLVYNVAVIVGALLGHSFGVVALAWSVVIGAAGQFLIQLPGLSSQIGRLYHRAIQWDLPAAREVLQLFVPRVVGVAAFQAMLLITLYLASRLPQGMVAAINYSWLLISFPLGAIGTAAATAIFPAVSRLTSASDAAAVRRTVNRGLRFVLFLTLPSAAGLVVLRRPIVNLLYGFALSHDYAEQVAFALLFYALALPALSTIEVTPRVFYALKDTVTPVRIAIVAVALDAFLSILFVNMLPKSSGQGGLALATAIATSIQALWLLLVLEARLGGIGLRSLYGTLRDATVASFAMAVVLYVLLDPLTAIFAQHGIGVFVTVAFEVATGAAVFGGIAYLLGAPELWEVRNFLPRAR